MVTNNKKTKKLEKYIFKFSDEEVTMEKNLSVVSY